MMPIQSMPSIGAVMPRPTTRTVEVKVTSNDPTMTSEVSRDAMVQVRGTASNNGIVRSKVTFKFDGQTVVVPLSKGMTGQDVQAELGKALPAGYLIQPVPTFAPTDDALFRIALQTNSPDVIAQGFGKAHQPGTHAGVKVSVTELRSIVKKAQADGFTADEKEELARQWSGSFTGAGFNATPAAQKAYARIQQQFDLPVFPIR